MDQVIKIFESNLGNNHLLVSMLDMNDEIKGPQCSRPREIKKKTKSTKTFFFFAFLHVQVGVRPDFRDLVIRSYHGESTVSHPNCEVKHRWA